MEKKTIIWHTPQAKLPIHDSNVVFYIGQYKRIGWYDENDSSFNDYYTGHDYNIESVVSWAYIDDLIAASKALEELEAEYDEFICNTWVEYADEPDDKLTSDARKLRDRMRRIMTQKILSERDQYKKALDVAIDGLKTIDDAEVQSWYSIRAAETLKAISEIIGGK